MSRAASTVLTWAARAPDVRPQPLAEVRRPAVGTRHLGRGVRVRVDGDVGVEVARRRGSRPGVLVAGAARVEADDVVVVAGAGRRTTGAAVGGVVGARRAGAAGVDHQRPMPLRRVGGRDLEQRELDGLAARVGVVERHGRAVAHSKVSAVARAPVELLVVERASSGDGGSRRAGLRRRRGVGRRRRVGPSPSAGSAPLSQTATQPRCRHEQRTAGASDRRRRLTGRPRRAP